MDFNINGNVISIDNETLKKALESETKDLTIESDLIVRTKEQENEWFNNAKKGTIDTAFDMKVKELRDKFELELPEGGKNFETLFDVFAEKNKSIATKKPNEQLQDKEKDILLLKNSLESLTSQLEAKDKEHSSFKNNILIDNTLSKHMPANLGYDKDDMALIIKNKLGISVQDGKIQFSKDGEVLKDQLTASPLGADKVFENFFTENKHYLKEVGGGGGGSDSTNDKPKNDLDSFDQKYTQGGGTVGSPAYTRDLNAHVMEQSKTQ